MPDTTLPRERPAVIHKTAHDLRVSPNLADYEAARRSFSWPDVAAELGMVPDGVVNIAQLAVDRHLATSIRDRVAFRFVSRDLQRRDVTFAELARLSNRWTKSQPPKSETVTSFGVARAGKASAEHSPAS